MINEDGKKLTMNKCEFYSWGQVHKISNISCSRGEKKVMKSAFQLCVLYLIKLSSMCIP